MRRSDLVVGESLYYAVGTGWHNRSGYGKWGRAVVVATEPYAEQEWLHVRVGGESFYPTTRGNGVLVDLYEWVWDPDVRGDVEPTKPRRTVVQLGHLRGPWGQLKAEVDAAEHQRLIDAHERQEAADEDAQIRHLLVARAWRLGLTGTRHDIYRQEITIATADLALLLDTYESGAS